MESAVGFGPIPTAAEFRERFPKYVEYETSKAIQRDVAEAVKLNRPILIEGGTGLGKTEGATIVAEKVGLRHASITCRHAEPEYLLGDKSLRGGEVVFEPSPLVEMIRNGGMCVLEEFNVLPHATRVRLRGLLDALNRDSRREFQLSENSHEVIQIHADFRLVLTQNEPGPEYPDREPLDPAVLSRVIYKKYEEELSREDKLAIAKRAPGELAQHAEWGALMDKLVVAYENLEQRKSELSQGQPQPLSFTFTRDFGRILHHMEVFHSGDINSSIQGAVESLLVGQFRSRESMEAVRELFRHVRTSGRSNPDKVQLGSSITEISRELGKNFFGPAQWKQAFQVDVGVVPPLPKEITAFLNQDSPLHPGEKIKDTHILMLKPKTVNGEAYTPLKLDELCSTKKGSGDKLIYDGQDWANGWKTQDWAQEPQVESEWVLIPKRDPDPANVPAEKHFRSKDVAAQQAVHDTHYTEYREVKAVEVMTAALLNDLVNGGPRLFEACYLRTAELNASGGPGRVCVGIFNAFGMRVDDGLVVSVVCGPALAGRALARKLKT